MKERKEEERGKCKNGNNKSIMQFHEEGIPFIIRTGLKARPFYIVCVSTKIEFYYIECERCGRVA
jgi:hypothetical protein